MSQTTNKILSVVETAYRGTIEEQDDTTLWFSHILKNSGADISVLLKSNAVNYAVKGQNTSGLSFGAKPVLRSVQIDQDLKKIIEKGVPVYLVEEDARDRGILDHEIIAGVQKISRNKIPEIFGQYEKIWQW